MKIENLRTYLDMSVVSSSVGIFQVHHLQDPHLSQLLQFFEQELHLPGQKPQTQVRLNGTIFNDHLASSPPDCSKFDYGTQFKLENLRASEPFLIEGSTFTNLLRTSTVSLRWFISAASEVDIPWQLKPPTSTLSPGFHPELKHHKENKVS